MICFALRLSCDYKSLKHEPITLGYREAHADAEAALEAARKTAAELVQVMHAKRLLGFLPSNTVVKRVDVELRRAEDSTVVCPFQRITLEDQS